MTTVNPLLISYGFSPIPRPHLGLGSFLPRLNDTQKKLAWVFQMPESADIQQIGIAINEAISPTVEYTLSLRGVKPDGTPEASELRTATIQDPSFPSFPLFTLNNPNTGNPQSYSACWGELLSVVVEYESGTFGPQKEIEFKAGVGSYKSFNIGFPYVSEFDNGWSRNKLFVPVYAVKAASGRIYGNTVTSDVTFPGNPVGNDHRVGMRFKLPAGFGSKFRVAGVRMRGVVLFSNATGPINDVNIAMSLWSDNMRLPPLQTAKFNAGELRIASGPDAFWPYRDLYFFDDQSNPRVDLAYGTEYFVAFNRDEPDTDSISMEALTVEDADLLEAFPGGKEVYAAEWIPAGPAGIPPAKWEHHTKWRPMIDLILDKYDIV